MAGEVRIQPRKLIITDPARADLDEVFDFIAVASPMRAESFIDELVADLFRVARHGYSGVSREWVRPGLRLHIFGSFNCYFIIDDDKFVVLRVLRGSRDVDAILKGLLEGE